MVSLILPLSDGVSAFDGWPACGLHSDDFEHLNPIHSVGEACLNRLIPDAPQNLPWEPSIFFW
jgi:hypothetical protein